MINVNELIQDCFQRTSLVGDGQSATGTQAMSALKDLNSLLAELSTQNYILSDIKTETLTATNKIVFGIVPDDVFYFDSFAEMVSAYRIGLTNPELMHEAFKSLDNILYVRNCDNNFHYYWTCLNSNNQIQYHTSEAFNKAALKVHLYPDIVCTDTVPDRLMTCARRIGLRFANLYPVNRSALDSRTKGGLSTMYSCEKEDLPWKLNDKEYHFERFVLDIDSFHPSCYRLTYRNALPKVKLDDTLYIDSKYEALIDDGLCVKLCQRYKLMDVKADFEKDYEKQKQNIKRINKANQPLVYDNIAGSYMDDFANGFGGTGW